MLIVGPGSQQPQACRESIDLGLVTLCLGFIDLCLLLQNMNCSDWIGRQSMGPSVDSSDFVEEVDESLSSQAITPTKTFQGEIPESETGKSVVGDGGLDSCEVVFTKDNVSVHPARYACERINGLLRLTKLGPSLFLTWTPPPPFDAGGRRGSADWRTAEKDKTSHTIRAVSLAEIRSIRRHTPSVGLQYITIVLTSGLLFPPLYFHAGGVKEFFAILRNHALLVRSIEDPSVYFVSSVHVQNREKQTMETTEEERDRDTQKHENKEEEHPKEKKEKDLEPELEKATETKDEKVQVPDPIAVGRPGMIYGSLPSSPMRHLDTPSRKRLRRSMAQDLPDLPPPNEEIVLKYCSSFHPIRQKEKETQIKSAKEEAINKARPRPFDQEMEAPFFDKEVQVVGPSSWPDTNAGNPSPPSMEYLDTPSRKRLRRSMPQVLPTLPPPKEEIVLKFSTSCHSRNPRKYFELVLPPVAGAGTPVCSRQRKTLDLVLSPVTSESSHVDIAPTSPHSIPGVEPELSPQPRTLEKASPAGAHGGALLQSPLVGKLCDDAAPSNALEYFSRLFWSGGFREGLALPVSWRNRLHLAELCSEECALARRRREWWLGMCLSVSVATTIPNHVICSLFTSELFVRLMVDSGLTYMALNSLKNVDEFGVLKHVTCGDICQFLKTFCSKAIRNRLRWARVGCAISGGVVDKGPDGQRSVVQQLANEEPLAASITLPLQQPPSASQRNDNREKRARRWVRRSARATLRQVFVEWGCRQITLDETVALAARFHGNPDAMQIMQLFRNWANLIRRSDKPAGSSTSHAQPTAGGRSRKRTESASPTQDAQQALSPTKKPSVHYYRSLQSESEPSNMEENALILAREVLLEAFQDKGYREITVDEAMALAVGFRGNPNASQIQLLFGKWAQEKRRRDKVAEDAKNYQEQVIKEQLITYRQVLHRTRLAETARQREDALPALIERPSVLTPVSGRTSRQSESQTTSMEDVKEACSGQW